MILIVLDERELSGAGMRKMLFCCWAVHEAAGGPPAFCVMEAGDGLDKSWFVCWMKQQRHVAALGGLIASGCKRLDRAADPNPILTSHLLSCDACRLQRYLPHVLSPTYTSIV
jgi:hypothetical protein